MRPLLTQPPDQRLLCSIQADLGTVILIFHSFAHTKSLQKQIVAALAVGCDASLKFKL